MALYFIVVFFGLESFFFIFWIIFYFYFWLYRLSNKLYAEYLKSWLNK
jgi:hypothetical protein